MDALSRKIKEMRLAHGWTLQKLSEESGVSQAVICYTENGRRMGLQPKSLYRLAKALGADPAEFARLLMDRQNGEEKKPPRKDRRIKES